MGISLCAVGAAFAEDPGQGKLPPTAEEQKALTPSV